MFGYPIFYVQNQISYALSHPQKAFKFQVYALVFVKELYFKSLVFNYFLQSLFRLWAFVFLQALFQDILFFKVR